MNTILVTYRGSIPRYPHIEGVRWVYYNVDSGGPEKLRGLELQGVVTLAKPHENSFNMIYSRLRFNSLDHFIRKPKSILIPKIWGEG